MRISDWSSDVCSSDLITKDEQFAPDYLKISPNNKIPAIVDPEGPDGRPLALFESGAILVYLAEKTGKLLPQDARARYEALQWLMWQMGGFGPMLGQAHHFRRSEEHTSELQSLMRISYAV